MQICTKLQGCSPPLKNGKFLPTKKRTKCSEQEMLRGKLSDGSLAHTFILRMPIAIRRENACSTTIHASADAIKITLNCDKKYPNKN